MYYYIKVVLYIKGGGNPSYRKSAEGGGGGGGGAVADKPYYMPGQCKSSGPLGTAIVRVALRCSTRLAHMHLNFSFCN